MGKIFENMSKKKAKELYQDIESERQFYISLLNGTCQDRPVQEMINLLNGYKEDIIKNTCNFARAYK